MLSKKELNAMYKQNQTVTYEKLNNIDISFSAKNTLVSLANISSSPLEPSISILKMYLNDKEENIKKDIRELIKENLVDENLNINKGALIF